MKSWKVLNLAKFDGSSHQSRVLSSKNPIFMGRHEIVENHQKPVFDKQTLCGYENMAYLKSI